MVKREARETGADSKGVQPRRRPRLLSRRSFFVASGGALAMGGGIVGGGCAISAPVWRGPITDHFDGKRFFNQGESEVNTFWDFLRWRTSREVEPWQWRRLLPGPPPPREVSGSRLRATFVNHATVLLQCDGLNILTDPIWSERCGPFRWSGPRRMHEPGVRFEDLPRIHLVLLSHNHYDHFDVETLGRLHQTHRPKFLCPLGNNALLKEKGIGGGKDLDWWETDEIAPRISVTAVPARHWSGRGMSDRRKNLWCGFVVDSPSGRVFFAGDTGYDSHFAAIRKEFAPFRLALLPIGAYRPRWFMKSVHMDPREAVQAHGVLGAEKSMAIHFGTFSLGDEGQDQAVEELNYALGQEKVPSGAFWAPEPGKSLGA